MLTTFFLFRRTFEYWTGSTPLLAVRIGAFFLWTSSRVNRICGRYRSLFFTTLDSAESIVAFGVSMRAFWLFGIGIGYTGRPAIAD
jgi:hypothetical protein